MSRPADHVALREAVKHRVRNSPAYFDDLNTTNGPTEVINGGLEYLRSSKTLPSTSPGRSSKSADSNPNYTQL